MRIIPVSLRFADQLMSLSSTLVDELQQLVASLQAMLSSLVGAVLAIEATWTDLVYSSTNYTTNNTGLISVTNAPANVYRYKLIGKTMLLTCSVKVTIGNGTTSEIRFRIPTTGTIKAIIGAGGVGDNVQMTAGVYMDSAGVSGVVMAAINTIGKYITVQRYDGAPGAVFVNGRDVTVGFMVQIPLV